MTAKKPIDHSDQITQLWTDHHEHLERTLAGWAGRHRHDPDLQDALAATFERTFTYLRRGGTLDHSPLGWLITVSRREFTRILSRKRATSELYDHDHAAVMADPAPGPGEVVLDQAQRTLDGALEKALSRLTPRERAVLTDVHAGYSYREIQERHGLSFTALNKALTRGRQKLRQDGALEQAYREWSD
jgi:RNA polymerase sigma factor (sigma-70 family)